MAEGTHTQIIMQINKSKQLIKASCYSLVHCISSFKVEFEKKDLIRKRQGFYGVLVLGISKWGICQAKEVELQEQYIVTS